MYAQREGNKVSKGKGTENGRRSGVYEPEKIGGSEVRKRWRPSGNGYPGLVQGTNSGERCGGDEMRVGLFKKIQCARCSDVETGSNLGPHDGRG